MEKVGDGVAAERAKEYKIAIVMEFMMNQWIVQKMDISERDMERARKKGVHRRSGKTIRRHVALFEAEMLRKGRRNLQSSYYHFGWN
jgi:FixJ family two-component response regulator